MVIATMFGLLALFSLISFALGTEDQHHPGNIHEDEAMFLLRFGNR